MAANIDQIFQDFVLKKIKEIQGRHEDKTATEGLEPGGELAGAEEVSKRDKHEDLKGSGIIRKQKKHKKHKHKKRKRNRNAEWNKMNSESESGTKHLPRGGTPAKDILEQGEINDSKSDGHKWHKSAKKKKKKRRKENSSDSETEIVSEPRTYLTVSPKRVEELPDIIPRQQHTLKKGRGQEETDGSQSHSCSVLHSCSSRKNSRSRSCSRSRCRHHHRGSRNQSTASLKHVRTKSSPSQRYITADKMTESSTKLQSPDQSEKPSGIKEESMIDLEKRKSKRLKAPERESRTKSSERHRRSKSASRSRRRGSRSKSRSPLKRKRSRSRSRCRRLRKSRSPSCDRRRPTYYQRDHWKQESSHSPILILRNKRSSNRKHCSLSSSPQRISELDKDQLLEIAKANAAAMIAKAATMTAALSNTGSLSSLLPLLSVTNKPPSVEAHPDVCALEEVKRKVSKRANKISIKQFTDECKMIVNSKGELPVAVPHVSDEEDNWKPFSGSALRDQKAICFSINSASFNPTVRCDAGMAKEFPVSSGSQHRKKEVDALDVYREWVPIDKTSVKAPATYRNTAATVSMVTATSSLNDTVKATGLQEVLQQPTFVTDDDCVFHDPVLQSVDISHAVNERIKAQRRLAENPFDVRAICMLSRAQEQVDAWAQSNTIPGFFTGSTGAQVLSSEDLSTTGPQAWLKKDQFLRATPVTGGVGEFLMRKMGWKTGEGLGRNREGTVEPIIIDFKVDRKGLVAEGEKPQKQTGGLVVTKDLMGKHPVSALIELCNKRRIMQPEFVMVHHSGPDHRKNFLFKVTVNGVDYQPQAASPNKKHAKAMAATVALQALGEVAVDGPGLYTGPVFTAASTGPLFST